MNARFAFLLPFVALSAAAAEPAAHAPTDFAWGWNVELDGGKPDGAWRLELTPEVYSVLVDPDRLDLELFDASGRPVPMAQVEPAQPPEPTAPRVALPVFAVSRPADAGAWDVRLRVARAEDRSLHQLDAQLAPESQGPKATDYLLDASKVDQSIVGLDLSWADTGAETKGRYAVEASDDLERWTTLVGAATVLELRQGGKLLERKGIDLPPSRAPYLRLRAVDGAELRQLRVEARLAAPSETGTLPWLEARQVEANEKPGVTTWELPGLLDVERVRVVPSGEPSVTSITVSSDAGEGWTERAHFALFQVQQEDEKLQRDEAIVGPGPRAKRWRIESTPPLGTPPRLLVAYRPDRYAFLQQGEGPFLLAAGSGTARRPDAPVEAALIELRSRFGRSWEPPAARLGEKRILGGEEALSAKKPLPWKTVLLWSVLAGGAALVGALAFTLLRREAASSAQ